MRLWWSTIAITLCLAGAAHADDDHFGIKVEAFQQGLQSQIKKLGVNLPIKKINCLDGDSENKKTVCSYKILDVADIELGSTIKEHYVDDATLVCKPSSATAIVECVTAYIAMIGLFTPNVESQKRKEIVDYLSKGINIGDSTTVLVEDNRYIFQKVMGTLWMHIEYGPG